MEDTDVSQEILIVDDAEFDRNLLKSILLSAGYPVAGTAGSGNEGISEYSRLSPDLVMLDLMMPDINGIDVLRKIRDLNPDAKVLMCTSVNETSMVELARRMGARGYVVKPYVALHLLAAVKKVIGSPSGRAAPV
jgi:two-component system chemotaxis response regulator CheY